MENTITFFLNSIFLGVALAMDSFSVSIADGLSFPKMQHKYRYIIPLNFGFFQGFMPFIGWCAVRTLSDRFVLFEKLTPWIGFFLLIYLGSDMIRKRNDEETVTKGVNISVSLLLVQGIATAIDALSVGFAFAHYTVTEVVFAVTIIAVITFLICIAGIKLGNVIGKRFRSHASMAGGIILIGIGIETLIKGLV